MSDKLISGSFTTGTGVAGFAGMIAMIPEGITKVACLIGIFGTFCITWATVRKSKSDEKIAYLEIERLKIVIALKGKELEDKE